MIILKLEKLISGTECRILKGDIETEISDVCSDSRKIKPGALFVCLDGLKSSGADYISEAIAKGANAVLISSTAKEKAKALTSESDTAVLEAENVRSSLAFLCSNLHNQPQDGIRIIAVTGTNGKTSVTQILKHIFTKAEIKAETIGTLDGSMTTPDPEELYKELEDKKKRGVSAVLMEASSHSLFLDKLAPLRPEIGIITNVTPDHLDFHKSMESYALAKSKLFSLCDIGLFNTDDPICKKMKESSKCEAFGFSCQDCDTDFIAKNICLLGESGGMFDFFNHFDLFRIRQRMPGMTGISNSLAAASAAYIFGINRSVIKSALADFTGVRGRLERVELDGADFSVFIDFAHTPDALEKLLRTVRAFSGTEKRIVLLFGCGGDRDRLKRPVMGSIAEKNADLVIVTSDNCRSEKAEDIILDILSGMEKGSELLVIPDRKEAIFHAVLCAMPSDVIILAGKGHETSELSGDQRKHFDEREIVKEAFEIKKQEQTLQS